MAPFWPPFNRAFWAPLLAPLMALALAAGCLSLGFGSRRPAAPFSPPLDRRLIAGVPFIPDDSSHCGPSTLAAVLSYHGRPTTKEEVARDVQRGDLRGSLGPDLVIWARQHGLRATFKSSGAEELIASIDRQKPVIMLLDTGIGPVRKGHFVVALGYGPDGLVINSGEIQQELAPWSTVLTEWYRSGNFAIMIEGLAEQAETAGRPGDSPELSLSGAPDDASPGEASPGEASPGEASPGEDPFDAQGPALAGPPDSQVPAPDGIAAPGDPALPAAAADPQAASPASAAAADPDDGWEPEVTQVVIQPAYPIPSDMLGADLPLDTSGSKQPVISFVGRPQRAAEAPAGDEPPYGVIVEESLGAPAGSDGSAGSAGSGGSVGFVSSDGAHPRLIHPVVPLPADDPLGPNAARAARADQAGQANQTNPAGQTNQAGQADQAVQASAASAGTGAAPVGTAAGPPVGTAQPAPTPPGVITVSPFIATDPDAAAAPPAAAPPEPEPVMGWER